MSEDIVETVHAASYTKGLLDGIGLSIKDVEDFQNFMSKDNSHHVALQGVIIALLSLKAKWKESDPTPD